jgi:hypothetical protein
MKKSEKKLSNLAAERASSTRFSASSLLLNQTQLGTLLIS